MSGLGGAEGTAAPGSAGGAGATERLRGQPRLGFLGTGWIGRLRLEAVAASGSAQIVAVADASPATLANVAAAAPGAALLGSLDALLELDLDGIVIATPSALHAEQAIAALERGVAVFCQKPLARTAEETAAVVTAARSADRLLAVDFSYRFTSAMRRVAHLVASGELGTIYAADLVFHNAYGPDKPWFYDRALAGGGCVVDLGSHLVDLGLDTLGFPQVVEVGARLHARGRRLTAPVEEIEDFATARLDLADGVVVQLACSWGLHAGRDAVIDARFYGTAGGAAFHNVAGSFYDFVAERYRGTSREVLVEPPDDWGGRAVLDWLERLARGGRYDPEAERLVTMAGVIDRIYASA